MSNKAEQYAAGFWRTMDFPAPFPRIARLREEVDLPVRAYPYRSHPIVHDVEEDGIVVLGIRHARADRQEP
jgi:toxin ParE1/3/4